MREEETMFRRMKNLVAALLVVSAISATTAAAQPIDYAPAGTHVAASGAQAPRLVTVSRVDPSSGGFDWGDAGIGAAAMLTLMGLGTGALVLSRRSRGPSEPATIS
jgi:hypothetical protein